MFKNHVEKFNEQNGDEEEEVKSSRSQSSQIEMGMYESSDS